MVGVGSGREELPVSASGSLVSAVGWERWVGVKFQVGSCLYLPAHHLHSPPTYSLASVLLWSAQEREEWVTARLPCHVDVF